MQKNISKKNFFFFILTPDLYVAIFNLFDPYLLGIEWVHTERKVGDEFHSIYQGVVVGDTLVNPWVPQAYASFLTCDLGASLDEPLHEVAEAYQIWKWGPGCRKKVCQIHFCILHLNFISCSTINSKNRFCQ